LNFGTSETLAPFFFFFTRRVKNEVGINCCRKKMSYLNSELISIDKKSTTSIPVYPMIKDFSGLNLLFNADKPA
jgi:hypothetical protein